MNIHPVLRKIIQLGSLFFIGLVLAACGAGSSSNDKSPAISTYAVTGTVTGDLVSGVTITLVNSANPTAGLFATSDTKGSYSFASLENGKYTATPAKTGYVFNPSSFAFEVSGANVILSPFSSKANVIQTYTISGKVTGDVTQNVKITLNSGASTLSTANGTYSFTGLSNGNYTLTPSLPGYDFSPASLSTTVKDSNVTLLNDFVATSLKTATYSISGTAATENGTALSGVTLSLTGFATTSTTTDASGKYSFPGLSNNSNYIVTPSKAGYIFSPNSSSANVSGADVSVVNFTATKDVAKTYTLSGTITGPGLAGVGLTLSPGGATTTSNASGNYSFPGLVNGNYTVTPSLANYTFTPSSVSANINNANATAGNLVSTALPPTQYTISGTVNGAVNVTINLTGAATKSVISDTNGNYNFAGLANGNYNVTPVKSGYTFNPASATANVSGGSVNVLVFTATVYVPPTYTLSGRVTGVALQNVLITLSGAASATTSTNSTGNYSFAGLANGSYKISPSKVGYTFSPASSTVTVNSANTSVADFIVGAPYKLNDTGVAASQCYEKVAVPPGTAGVPTYFVDCRSTGAITLSAEQDGNVGRDANVDTNNNIDGNLGFSFSSVPGGCIVDNVTGLMWENKTAANSAATYNTNGASSYVGTVNSAALCGFNDWRLPTPTELHSIIDYGTLNAYGPKIDTAIFPNTQNGFYWTGTLYKIDSTKTWGVYFSIAAITGSSATDNTNTAFHYVRLVRGGIAAAPAFIINGAEVTDQRTGLIWKRCAEGMGFSGTACTGIASGASVETALPMAANQPGGWRLPNIKELASIADLTRSNPALDTAIFPLMTANNINLLFRTSTPDTDFPGYAYYVDFKDGASYAIDASYLYSVLLVRNAP